MRRVIIIIVIVLIFLGGIFLTAYPYLYNAYTEKHHSEVMDNYSRTVETISQEELDSIRQQVAEYNDSLLSESSVLTDPFDPEAYKNHDSDTYARMLNINGDGIIALLSVPKINVNLPVYHGTDEEIISRALGHLEGTSMPIGGPSTHSVITGHTGLSNQRLFTDLTELQTGDVFYIDVLNETLAYEIDRIDIVEPDDTSLLSVYKGEDYVTLLTCYPYGINSHRLMVRGTRIPYDEAVEQEKLMEENTVSTSQWDREYIRAIAVCLAGYSVLLVIFIIVRKKRSKKNKEADGGGRH